MRFEDFLSAMEELAPKALALDFDNVGVITEPESKEIRRVLVALDLTVVTAREAVDGGVDLVLTHHPRFFSAVKHMTAGDHDTAAEYMLIRNGIGHFAAHTNLDAAEGGVNTCLANVCGIMDAKPYSADGMGRLGSLEKPVAFFEYARFIEKALATRVRVSGEPERMVSRVAVLGGQGGEYVGEAAEAGADVYISGEFKHHQAIEAMERGIAIIEAGHYETERIVLRELITRLQKRSHDVQYILSRREKSPLHCID